VTITGIQIFKILPKTNCGECGSATCLAFAMDLISGNAATMDCPYIPDEKRAELDKRISEGKGKRIEPWYRDILGKKVDFERINADSSWDPHPKRKSSYYTSFRTKSTIAPHCQIADVQIMIFVVTNDLEITGVEHAIHLVDTMGAGRNLDARLDPADIKAAVELIQGILKC
jgi:hypothetical protein